MKKYEIDYYVTVPSSSDWHNSEYSDYSIINKIWMKVSLSNDNFEDNFDVFINKRDIDVVPGKNDIIVFKNLKSYSVLNCQDGGDFYVVNICKYKIKE